MVLYGAVEHRLHRVILPNSTFCSGFPGKNTGRNYYLLFDVLGRPSFCTVFYPPPCPRLNLIYET